MDREAEEWERPTEREEGMETTGMCESGETGEKTRETELEREGMETTVM